MENDECKECWKQYINDKDGSFYYHNFMTNEFSSEKQILIKKSSEKKYEKFFRLNPVNINYLKICQQELTDEFLFKHCSLLVNCEFSKENYKIFYEKIENLELNYSKFRQESNEYIKNWFKLKIKH